MQNKSSIIIADDNQGICENLIDIFSEKGYFVEAVNNGYELLSYLKKKSSDIIILDLMMPEKDGIEILSAIKTISNLAEMRRPADSPLAEKPNIIGELAERPNAAVSKTVIRATGSEVRILHSPP